MFDTALLLVLHLEGGFSNDPDDPGGATNFGITQNVYDPTGKKPVKNITIEEVKKIYQQQYWQYAKCDQIDTVSPGLAIIHFDNAVNCGVVPANRMLQDVLHVNVDGIIGPITASKFNDSQETQLGYLHRRQTFYDSLVMQRPRLAKFKPDWYYRLTYLARKLDIPFKL